MTTMKVNLQYCCHPEALLLELGKNDLLAYKNVDLMLPIEEDIVSNSGLYRDDGVHLSDTSQEVWL